MLRSQRFWTKSYQQFKRQFKEQKNNMDKEFLKTQKEIVMLLAILVKRDVLQSTVIQEMGTIGFSPKRIAESFFSIFFSVWESFI